MNLTTFSKSSFQSYEHVIFDRFWKVVKTTVFYEGKWASREPRDTPKTLPRRVRSPRIPVKHREFNNFSKSLLRCYEHLRCERFLQNCRIHCVLRGKMSLPGARDAPKTPPRRVQDLPGRPQDGPMPPPPFQDPSSPPRFPPDPGKPRVAHAKCPSIARC